MFPLAGSTLPHSPDSLLLALREGLAGHALPARKVIVTGDWPALGELRIDLTGLRVDRSLRAPVATEPGVDRVTAASFALVASPLQFEDTPLQVHLRATQASFGFAQSEDGVPVLVLATAQEGDLALEVRRDALEALLQGLAAKAAGEHGVEIKKTRLELTSRSPRALAFQAEVTAKMFIITAALTLSGEIDVDDHLNARLSNLRFAGDGMIAKAASGFIRPQLDKLEGRTFPLLAFSLGNIKLRDLQLSGGDSLKVTAQFGSAA